MLDFTEIDLERMPEVLNGEPPPEKKEKKKKKKTQAQIFYDVAVKKPTVKKSTVKKLKKKM